MIEAAVAAVTAGNVIGLPTDTVYGLGADPLNEEAVAKLFNLKGRPANKPVGVLVSTPEQACQLGKLEGRALELAEEHWPGALTLVVRQKAAFPDRVGDSKSGTIGVRVPDHEAALAILEATGPLAVTSANRTDGPESNSDAEAREMFGDGVSLYVEGTSSRGAASTVVDAATGDLRVIRMGPVTL